MIMSIASSSIYGSLRRNLILEIMVIVTKIVVIIVIVIIVIG